MVQGIQTTFKHEALRKYGCYFFALLRWAEMEKVGPGFTDEEVINKFDHCKDQGWIEDDCFVVNPVAILNYAAGQKVVSTIFKSVAAPQLKRFIVYLKKPSIGHFVLSDSGSIWDSWTPSAVSQNFPIDSYRVLR